MGSELQVLAARKDLLATRCSLQRLRIAQQIAQIRGGLPFAGGARVGGLARVLKYAGLAMTVLRFFRSFMGPARALMSRRRR
jgi:hypothetical protein